MNVPVMYNFQSLPNKFSTIFCSLIFHILLTGLHYFFLQIYRKRKPKNFRILKCNGERNHKNSHFHLEALNCTQNFRKNNTEALVISKRLKFPQDDRTDKNVVALLRMHFQIFKNTLDSLKSDFNIFWRKLSLGVPVIG